MKKVKIVTFAAIMAALTNVLSVPPLAIPIVIGPFETSIHFSQLPIFIGGILGGPLAGLMVGCIGGLYMSIIRIPFIIGGLAILGYTVALFARRFRPFFSGVFAWCVQAPYVLVTDYVWFALFLQQQPGIAWSIVTGLMIKLAVEAVIASALADFIITYVKRRGITL